MPDVSVIAPVYNIKTLLPAAWHLCRRRSGRTSRSGWRRAAGRWQIPDGSGWVCASLKRKHYRLALAYFDFIQTLRGGRDRRMQKNSR